MSGLTSEKASYLTVEQVSSILETDLIDGLNQAEVSLRRNNHGHNELVEEEEETLIKRYLEQFKEPMILLLLASAVVSVLMGQFDDALSISIAIIIVVTVAFIQEYRSEKSLQELKKLMPPACHCIREGKLETFLARDLVPGDIICLGMGDRVPADVRLFEAVDLSIDESSFTGEPKPSRKHISICSTSEHISDRLNIAYMGTLVCNGNGKGIVIGTGEKSEFGLIFKMMQAEDAPKTPLQKNMDGLGKQLSLYSFFIIGFIVIMGWIQSRPIVEMFTIGVSLAVAAIPEGLPIVVTVTLALGVMRMARRKTIVKKLPAVETLGCVNVICCDKTGTLTKNQMTVVELITSDDQRFTLTQNFQYEHECQTVTKLLSHVESHQGAIKLLEVAIACNNAKVLDGELYGSPTERALITCANLLGCNTTKQKRLEEWPFSSETRTMMVKCCDNQMNITYYLKGSMEEVLKKCYTFYDGSMISNLNPADRQRILNDCQQLGLKGLRTLSLASSSDGLSYCYLGMVGIVDPPRPGVKDAIHTLYQCGVKVKMITGDSKETAVSIASSLDIFSAGDLVLSGSDIERMNTRELQGVITRVSVFYRTSPIHKTKIINSLKECDLVVGMTGDGVNDAIALKSADIGIAMGDTGTDVSKEAADVILVDDQITSLIAAIEEGRGIFHNIRNFVRFQLSTSIAALSLITTSTLVGLPNPLNAMQILWINILMDGPPAQSLGVEPVDHEVIRMPPRKVKEPIINSRLITNVLISSIVIVLGTLYVFYNEMSDNHITPRDTTMTFTCFVLFDMFNAMSCRSQTKSIFSVGFFTNKVFLLSVGGSLVGQLLVIYFPPLQAVFQTEALYFTDIVFLLCLTSIVFFVSEIRKYCVRNDFFVKKVRIANGVVHQSESWTDIV